MAYPCPKCGEKTRTRHTAPVLGKQVPVIKRKCRCPNPDCDAQFFTAEFVVGPITEHYGAKRAKKAAKPKPKPKEDGIQRKPPQILTPLYCPHCNGEGTWIRSTGWQDERTYVRYHGCSGCGENFYTYTDAKDNDTSVHKKSLPKED